MSRAPETPFAIIHNIAATDPDRALLAAVLRLAVTDAIGHDLDAARWLMSPACANLLGLLIPDTSGMSAEQLQAHLLARLPVAIRRAAQNATLRDESEQPA